LPLPIDLIIIDLPENERIDALVNSFDLLSPGGIIIIKEPEVPTGDVGEIKDDVGITKAQEKVLYFNKWIKAIRSFSEHNSLSFVELNGGSLVILRHSG
jgi:predicted O-methyltransferase YrrM